MQFSFSNHYANKPQAEFAGQTLLEMVKTKGWTVIVDQNGDGEWIMCLELAVPRSRGGMRLYAANYNDKNSFVILNAVDALGLGDPALTGTADDPNDAIRQSVNKLSDICMIQNNFLQSMRETLRHGK